MKYLVMSIVLVLCSCRMPGDRDSRKMVDSTAAKYDPAEMELQQGYNDFLRYKLVGEDVQAGTVRLKDGEVVKFWFASHHLTSDMGTTRFDFADGKVVYFKGYFCCEVQLPEENFTSRKELLDFLSKNDEAMP